MKDIEKTVRLYLEERGWDKLRPSDIAKSITIEASELLENFQWESLSIEEVKARPELLLAVKKELADVLIYCFEMAVLLDIDTEKAFREKLALAAKKYPAELMKNMKAEPGTGLYWEIKKAHRAKKSRSK